MTAEMVLCDDSIQNQAAAIAAFAQENSLTIARTYVDKGRSGLRIKGRAGLLQLIDDVNSGQADFGHILVYDVSRWGRGSRPNTFRRDGSYEQGAKL